uniref:Uncharacterized protein n=1 Tax=Lepeophtheirus salmonis TaxID=72036 RepID=A0A0K2TFK4_LEPSM
MTRSSFLSEAELSPNFSEIRCFVVSSIILAKRNSRLSSHSALEIL